jgi:RNA polymerase sigma-B factor
MTSPLAATRLTVPQPRTSDSDDRSLLDERQMADDNAAELLRTMAALPARHPSRPALREQAIEAWLPLAYNLANRFANRGEPLDDIVQTATIGLIKAIDKYDPSRGVEFTAYAVPTVIGEIKRHFRDRTWDVRVPRRIQELRLTIVAARNNLMQELSREPTIADIAEFLQLTEQEVLEGYEGTRAYNAVSLQTPALGADQQGTSLGDLIGSEDQGYAIAEMRVSLTPALSRLDERTQRILMLRFYGNLTQSQIAEQIGISQMHVSRLLAKALSTLHDELDGASFTSAATE